MKKLVFGLLLATGLPVRAEMTLPTGVDADRLGTEIVWSKIRALPAEKRPRVILVLGGGGARGLAHVGVLDVFEQEHIPVDQVVGVSVGALIGALYAGGVPIEKIASMAAEIGWNKLTDFSRLAIVRLILGSELLSTKKMETFINNYLGDKTFADLKIPFACVATDLRTGDGVMFREGPVAIAARASATIPGIFRPVEYRQRYLVDGGLTTNLPTNLVEATDNDVLIAVLPQAEEDRTRDWNSFLSLVRSIEIQKDRIIRESRKTADITIEPNVDGVSFIDLDQSAKCIEAGAIAARRAALDVKRTIIGRALEMHERAPSEEGVR